VWKNFTGSISVTLNPLRNENGGTSTIEWRTNDPLGGELWVFTTGEGDKLISRGTGGSVQVDWIQHGRGYNFLLYGLSQPRRKLASLALTDKDKAGQKNSHKPATPVSESEAAHSIVKVVPRCLHSPHYPEFFGLWEKHGFHVTPVHFYQPIPDTRTLGEKTWSEVSELPGIDMNEATQLDLLLNQFPRFREEYERFESRSSEEAGRFDFNNGLFGGTDALVAYCMIRHFKPRLIIEIGSGFSSLISGEAAALNERSALICVEPFPKEFLRRGFPGLHSLIEKKVQDLGLDFFSQLDSGDILFIDSSHTVKIGGDVNYLFLEVLPRLKPGVIVHIHDIFLPFEYRRDWIMEERRFWTEQYLLQAFLMFNSEFEVLMGNSYLGHYHLEDLKATFPNSPWWGGGSFWIRRRVKRNEEAV
jgi:hypothetical protein